jgi:hypothetical protein
MSQQHAFRNNWYPGGSQPARFAEDSRDDFEPMLKVARMPILAVRKARGDVFTIKSGHDSGMGLQPVSIPRGPK